MNANLKQDEDYQLWSLLRQTSEAICKAREKELNPHGITNMEAATLLTIQMIIETGEEATPAEVSRWLFREHHTISSLIRRMVRKGLISQKKSPIKKNIWRLSITEKGMAAYKETIEIRAIRDSMKCLTRRNREQLETCLKKMRKEALELLASSPVLPFP